MNRYCLALDLKNDPEIIAGYEAQHKAVWPEIIQTIRDAHITVMDIYRTGNRLFMIMETTDDFSFEEKSAADASNPVVQKWEAFMSTFQQALPWAKDGEKWVLMDKIFGLPE
jgi:L-rhamnose mutarotase